jgi:hypothetical protein
MGYKPSSSNSLAQQKCLDFFEVDEMPSGIAANLLGRSDKRSRQCR